MDTIQWFDHRIDSKMLAGWNAGGSMFTPEVHRMYRVLRRLRRWSDAARAVR